MPIKCFLIIIATLMNLLSFILGIPLSREAGQEI